MYLITTAIEQTWKVNTPVLFLGEWCKRYSKKNKWQDLNYETVEYHWDDREKLYNDYCYLNELYENTLKKLTLNLNAHHKTNYSVRYWRIILGPWLGEFIEILFDRWQMVTKAVSEFDISETTILKMNDSKIVPESMAAFMSLSSGDEWNHYIYGKILQKIKPEIKNNVENYTTSNRRKGNDKKLPLSINSILRKIKKITRILLGFLTNSVIKYSEYFFIDIFLSGVDQTKLELSLTTFPSYLMKRYCIRRGGFDYKKRSSFRITGFASSEFEIFLYDILPKQIPETYLEGYSELENSVNNCVWPYSPKVIMTCTAHVYDDFFKLWAANKIEAGSKLVIAQHCSLSGSAKWYSMERHELKISDNYFSWGYFEDNGCKIVPNSPARLINSKVKLKSNPRGGLLQVLTSFPRYSYHLYSSPISSQMLSYEKEQIKFARNLSNEIREQLTVRPYIVDYGWDQINRWNDEFPEVILDSNKSFYTTMNQNRLLVGSGNSTVVSEALSANIPTIVFWNMNHWELRKSAEPFYQLLINVNILHSTPESAANFINETWDSIELWWNSYEVQNVVSKFCNEFANSQENWVTQWKENLTNLCKKKKDNLL